MIRIYRIYTHIHIYIYITCMYMYEYSVVSWKRVIPKVSFAPALRPTAQRSVAPWVSSQSTP